MSGTKDIIQMIANAKTVKPKAIKKGFQARPGSLAACREVLGCSEPCAVLAFAILELWVEQPNKIIRLHEGEKRPFLYLSGNNLATLTGRDKKTLQNRVIPELKAKKAFVLIEQAKLTPEHEKEYRISVHVTPLCEAIIQELQPFRETTQQLPEGGGTATKRSMDRNRLPYVFRRLYDEYKDQNGPFQP